MTALRFFVSSVFHNETTIVITSDGHYLLSNQQILSMIMSLGSFFILFIGLLLQINEINYTVFINICVSMEGYEQLIPLNEKNRKKLAIIINLMAKVLMKQAFWPLVVFSSLLSCGAPVVAHFDHKYDYSIASIVFFNICLVVWLLQFYCIVCAGFVAWSAPFFYFKFKEIFDKFKICMKGNNLKALKNLISQHNRLVIQTKLIDDVFKFVVFILYYVGGPALMLLLYLSHANDSKPLSRSVFILIVSIVYFVVFYLNFICAEISHSTSKPRVLMYKYLIEHNLNIEDRIKIMAFLESLNGSEIGFHC